MEKPWNGMTPLGGYITEYSSSPSFPATNQAGEMNEDTGRGQFQPFYPFE